MKLNFNLVRRFKTGKTDRPIRKELPFSTLESYRRLMPLKQGGATPVSESLEKAALISAGNLAGFDEDTRLVIAMDVSHSMARPVRGNSFIQRFDIGPLLAMLLKARCRQVTAGIIGNTWKLISLPEKYALKGTDLFHSHEGEAGFACNAHLVIRDLLRRRKEADKILIFTDCPLWNTRSFHQPADADLRSIWRQYRQIAPAAKLYLFDLSTVDQVKLNVPEESVFTISGWNDGIFDALKAAEDAELVIEMINNIAI